MVLTLRFYDRDDEYKPRYDKSNFDKIYGESADDCMKKLAQRRLYHDLFKYTPIEIVYVED